MQSKVTLIMAGSLIVAAVAYLIMTGNPEEVERAGGLEVPLRCPSRYEAEGD